MSDQTHIFLEISRKKLEENGPSSKTVSPKPRPPDKLTEECLKMRNVVDDLKQYLIKIRPSYLSNSRHFGAGSGSSMTDKQRDEIDYEARMILQQQTSRLRALEDLEKQRIERYNSRSTMAKFMQDPKAEGTEHTIQLHRAGIFWYLNDLLKTVSDLHASQQQIRLSRQLEKAKSTFHHVPEGATNKRTPSGNMTATALNNEESSSSTHQGNVNQTLSPQLQTELENENNALLDELELSLDKAKSAEKSMYEISQLQSELATHLSSQSDMIQNLLENASQTSADVTAANKQLTSSGQRNRLASKIIIYTSVILALLLLFYDAWL